MIFVYSAVTVEPDGGKLLLRENGGRVFAQRGSYAKYFRKAFPDLDGHFEAVADWSEDVLLYDFTLSAGDVYPFGGDVHVASVSSMTTRDGLDRKVLFLDNGLEIIEGVGCINSPFGVFAYQNGAVLPTSPGAPASRPSSAPVPAYAAPVLKSFTKSCDEEPLYVMGDELTGVPHRYAASSPSPSPVTYDLQGRLVTGTPQRGIYIRNGRKYVK